MTATGVVFAAVQDWQTGRGSCAEAAQVALDAADGDETQAKTLLTAAAILWQTVVDSAALPYVSGEDGSDIGPAHGRPRYSGESLAAVLDAAVAEATR